MEIRNLERNEIAELKLAIMQQQEQVATLARAGQKAKARRSRDSLIALLNRLDVLEAISKPTEFEISKPGSIQSADV